MEHPTYLNLHLSSTNSPTRKTKIQKYLNLNSNGALIDIDLYQTRYCSRLTRKNCDIECLLSLDHENGQFIELKACAPELWREELFYFVQDLYTLVECVIHESCSNLNLERHYLSFKPVAIPNEKNPDSVNLGLIAFDCIYTPKDLILMQYESDIKNRKNGTVKSTFVDLVCCGSEKIAKIMYYGIDVPFSQINTYTRRMLCAYLDKTDPMGRDWTILAFLLGLQDILPNLEDTGQHQQQQSSKSFSKCEYLLNEWCKKKPEQATISYLISKIADLDRKDVYDLMLNTIGLFQMDTSKDSGIQNSNQTLASIK